MQRHLGWLAIVLITLTAIAAEAEDKKEKKAGPGTIYTDPAKAGPDYAVQGEFSGELSLGDQKRKVGVQVIALGAGKFRMVGYLEGLPGDGYKKSDRDRRKILEASRKDDGSVVFDDPDGINISLKGDTITVIRKDNDAKFGELKRVHRKSKTLGKKPPKGAIVLFDGKSAEGFVRGKLVGKLLAANCESKEKFGDHQLHLEFRTPFKPYDRGQARGNSGMYVQSRYEVQILDSFGLDGKNNECGGIYQISEPAVNMCYPPLTWQTYDVVFTAAKYKDGNKVENARITVEHNGVKIHDNLELPKHTPGKLAEGPEPLGVYLQGHGNPVVFRNIWVVKK